MSGALPMTVAEILNEELQHVHGKEGVPHSWIFTEDQVRRETVAERLRKNMFTNDAYEHLAAVLGWSGAPDIEPPSVAQLNGTLGTLFDGQILSSRMIPPAVQQMHEQVAQLGSKATADEISRVNRVILEHLFPVAIDRAEIVHLKDTQQQLHDLGPKALCLSGGGIRSATFALGILQALARVGNGDKENPKHPIEEIDYLSTVSGGGYIGAWLSAWINRAGPDPKKVFQALRGDDVRGPLAPEPAPLRWLRDYSNYLAPRFSLFSVDTGTLIATWFRNVLINWLTFLPFLAVLMLLPRAITTTVASAAPVRGWPLFVLGTLFTILSVALMASALPSEDGKNRPWRLRRIHMCRAATFAAALIMPLFWATVAHDNVSLIAFALFGAGVQVIGQIIPGGESERLPRFGVLLAAAFSGVVGGGALYLLTRIPCLSVPVRWPDLYALVAPPAFILAFLVSGTLFIGLTARLAPDDVHEYWNRLGASLMLGAVAYSVVTSISLYGPLLLTMWPKIVASVGGVTGLVGILLGGSGISPALEKEDRGRTFADRVTAVLIPIFVAVLLAVISWAMTALFINFWRGEFPYAPRPEAGQERKYPAAAAIDHLLVLRETSPSEVWMIVVAMAVLATVASNFADINKFSMHGLYRMRLIRAYLGASYHERNPDPFTGFDLADVLFMDELKNQKPFHVVNMALNLVRGKRLAWQQRKASTFTASPLHCGNWQLGYRSTRKYGKPVMGLDLGTAITISGAAASSNMGYHSSPPLSFLLTMFNVRLGAWLGNPGVAGGRRRWYDRWRAKLPELRKPRTRRTPVTRPQRWYDAVREVLPAWQRSSPRSSIAHQLAEAFGWTDDDHQYVYLSDGGHFENLGVYEMILRRCRYIIVSDAGADPDLQFEDLGNAVRKIRIDFGIPIEFRRFALVSREEKQPGAHCALGRIQYSAVDGTSKSEDGYLLYIKATYYASGPQDVRQYARKARRFPHESTADQFFTESQFESYRRLGEWVIETIVGTSKPATMDALFNAAHQYENRQAEVTRW